MSLERARELTQESLAANGYSEDESRVITDHLLDCELRGLSFGGLARALSVIERVRATGPRGSIRVVSETQVSAQLDGGDEVGYLVASQATDLAIAKAQSAGIAVVGANQTWYTGMFSYYLERVTEAGLVGMAAGSGGHIVAPYGSNEARFGTNPIAFGFPSSDGAVIWDIGTSELMLGEALLAHRLGQPLPDGVAFNREGQPTTTPLDVIGGAITVWGGHKGSGLALVVQLLGMLAGASGAPEGLTDCGFLLIIVDPGLLGSLEDYRARVAEYAASVRAARPIDPQRPVRVPFDRSAGERARRLELDELEVPNDVHNALSAFAERSGAAVPMSANESEETR